MAKFRTDTDQLLDQNQTIYEVVMISDADGNLVTQSDIRNTGNVSVGNATTTPLANNATYTGTWEDVGTYDSVTVAVKTSEDGYFSVQFSPDGANTDSTLTRYYRTNQIEAPHRFTITRKYCRVSFTNHNAAGNTQSFMRLQTMYGSKSDLNAPADSTLAQDFDSIAVRPTNYNYETALGLRQGSTTWNKWGYNNDVDAAEPEMLRSWNGNTINYMTTASTLNVSSTSTDDNVAQIGTSSVVMYGINQDRKSVTEVVFLNGTVPVTTTNQYLGVNRMALYLSGNNDVNVGTIDAIDNNTGTIQGEIPAGEGSTQQCMFFTQAGHKGLIDWLKINATKITGGGGSPVVTFKGWVKSFVSGSKYEVFRYSMDTAVENGQELTPSQPFVVDEKSLFWLEVETDTNNTVASARFSLIEHRNKDTFS